MQKYIKKNQNMQEKMQNIYTNKIFINNKIIKM
jgi:hypothetical protein